MLKWNFNLLQNISVKINKYLTVMRESKNHKIKTYKMSRGFFFFHISTYKKMVKRELFRNLFFGSLNIIFKKKNKMQHFRNVFS